MLVHGTEVGIVLGRFPPTLSERETLRLRRLYLGSLRLVCSSSASAAMLTELHPALRERTVVVPPAVDPAAWPNADPDAVAEIRRRLVPERDSMVLCVARLAPDKGQDTLIRALPTLTAERTPVRLVLVGDGPLQEDLEELARCLGVRERVVFTGPLSEEDLAAHYAAADLFAMISRSRVRFEGFGIVFLEAALESCAALGGDTGGVPEAIVNGVTGWLVDPESPAAVADAIRRALSRPEALRAAGKAARRRVFAEFTIQRMSDRLRSVTEVMNPAGRNPPARSSGYLLWAGRTWTSLTLRAIRRRLLPNA